MEKRRTKYDPETCTLDEALSELRDWLTRGVSMAEIANQVVLLMLNNQLEEWQRNDPKLTDFLDASVAYEDNPDDQKAAEVIRRYLQG